MPLKGTFPYYSDGVVGESYGKGNYKATNGRLYKVTDDGTAGTPLAWYPAPGYRERLNGDVVHSGLAGYSLSSAPRESRCMFMNFGPDGLNPDLIEYRAHGLQLRCLSE